MQKIHFGLALDGQSGWLTKDAVGETTFGAPGMLTALATQHELLRVPVSQAERVVQFRACLQRACTGSHFADRSFVAPHLGTAATLLGWRDQWWECGWAGQMSTHAVEPSVG